MITGADRWGADARRPSTIPRCSWVPAPSLREKPG